MLARVGKLVANYAATLDAQADPAKAAEYDNDLLAMQENRLEDLMPGGDALKLLHEVMGRGPDAHPAVYAAREGWQKMTALEVTAQLGQRIGLAWTLLAFGNVGATAASRAITAALGGPDKAPIVAQFGGAVLSTAFGAVGAAAQWMVANAKNERRADPDRVGFLAQLTNSVLGPMWQQHQRSEADKSLREAVAANRVHQHHFPPHTIEDEFMQRFGQPGAAGGSAAASASGHEPVPELAAEPGAISPQSPTPRDA
jgi:hypothetical protein